MAHAVEREIIKITSYKSRTKFDDRQDYLSSILNATMKMTDEDFDNLSDDAASWINAAVVAHNGKEDIPDFDEIEASAENDPPEDDADDADDASEDSDDTEDGEDPEDDDTGDGDPDSADDLADPDTDDADDGPDEAAEKPAKAKKAKTKAPPKPVKAAVKAEKPVKRKPVDDDVVLDKFGCMEGSKNSRALVMFAKGATAREVKDELGGTYYNILKKMVEDGHTIEKDGAIIKVIHKDDKNKKVEKPAKAAVKKPKK